MSRRALTYADVISSANELRAAVKAARERGRTDADGRLTLDKPVRLNFELQQTAGVMEDTFRPHDLRGADLSALSLNLADFRGADLTGADLSNTYLRATLLGDILLYENAEVFSAGGGAGGLIGGEQRRYRTTLTGAKLDGAIWSGVNATGMIARDLRAKGAHFESCTFVNADISDSDLRGAKFDDECGIAGMNAANIWRLPTDMPVDIRSSGEILSVFAAGEALATLSAILLAGIGYGSPTVRSTAAIIAVLYLFLTVQRYVAWRRGKSGVPEVPTTTMLVLSINSILALIQLLGGPGVTGPRTWILLTWGSSFAVYVLVRLILYGRLRPEILLRRPWTDIAVAVVLPLLYTGLYFAIR
jgi:pentapeptide repeat protein